MTSQKRSRNEGKITHGYAFRGKKVREYGIWSGMKGRCYRPTHKQFKDWGGRGIAVCERWRTNFAVFLADMGRCPGPEYTLDRIDNDGNYEPGNCRWATRLQQQRNTRVVKRWLVAGELLTIGELAERYSINEHTLRSRLYHGMPCELAVAPRSR